MPRTGSGLVVGVDLATADVRAVAMDDEGRARAEARHRLPAPTAPRPGWSEQDARGWWPAVAAALSELTGHLGQESRAVVAVTVCATSGTVLVLDGDGDPLGSALMYSDQRAGAEAEAAHKAAAARWERLGLRIQPSSGLAKWGWLVHQPGFSERARRLAHASDVVVRQLVGGDAPTDWSHALKSGFDPLREEWATEAMAELGIAEGLLPEVRRPTEVAGRVGSEAAAATGLPEGADVRLGMTDACAAQLAAGAASPGRFVSVLGSTLVLKGASQDLVVDPAGAVYSHRHPNGWWLPGGASNTGGQALTAGFGEADLATLDDQAAGHGPARAVVYPLVGRGERFPFAAAEAEGFSLGDTSDEIERYRATLEGVAFVERLGYERLRSLGAEPEPPIVAAGGGSHSRVWSRIRATVLGQPIVEMPDADTARGACVLAAAGSLHADLQAATEAMTPTGEQVDPDPETADRMEESYGRFVAALRERGWLEGPG